MQRIREFSWAYLYKDVLSDVIRNSIAIYMVELLHKCLKQPEANADLFNFCEAALIHLDESERSTTANYPLFFALQLPHFFGFRMDDNYSTSYSILDLMEGNFTGDQPTHPHFIDGENAGLTSQLLKVMQPHELNSFSLNRDTRRSLLLKYHDYYALHIHEFGQMKTLRILTDVL